MSSVSRLSIAAVFVCNSMLAGCAAEGGRAPIDELHDKQEARVGAVCRGDTECDAGEYCDLRVCIPEGPPCPPEGVCRLQTRFYDNDGADIPDADPAGVVRTLTVDRPPASVASAYVHVAIRHTWRGDLRVVLVSPSGTEHPLHDRTGGSADDLSISADVTRVFEGEPANGDWTLVVSDHVRQDVGRLLTWRLELDFALPRVEPPDPGTDVWATVELPSTESLHPYANDTDQTWDLRRFTGGAERARLRFARIEVERGYDRVEVVDLDSGGVLDSFTGTFAAFATREYATGSLGVRLVSDYSITAWGFRVAAVEVFGSGCLDDDDCPAGTQCPTEVVRCITWPCFLTCRPVDPGGEGDGCASTAECADDLYCAGDGFCRAVGGCAEVADCSRPDNPYPHPMCVGHPTCDGARCGWTCAGPITCEEGETTDDGCNTCTCSGGEWACTERYCPPVVGEGEACDAGVLCDEGLVCDRGPTDGASCVATQPGVCVPEPEGPRYCRAVYSPVCACNGQTFDSGCERAGMAAWAHAGECLLDLAIPDADAEGIRTTVDVQHPAASHAADVDVRIDHTWRGDLVVVVEAPDGSEHVLTHRAGRDADDFVHRQRVELGGGSVVGTWTFHVSDHASLDTGVLRHVNVRPR